jgi:hypothetical protein
MFIFGVQTRAVNSAVEYLPYKQAATSSNLVPPIVCTWKASLNQRQAFLFFYNQHLRTRSVSDILRGWQPQNLKN